MAEEYKKTEQLEGNLDFGKVIFLHINRILMYAATDSNAFIVSIEALEDSLYTYKDENYTKDLKAPMDSYNFISGLDPLHPQKGQLMGDSRLQLARQKFRALMGLANRKNLLLARIGEGFDKTGDEGYDTV